MNPIAKIIIALVIGGAAWGISMVVPAVPTIVLFLAAAVISALLPSMGNASASAPAASSGGHERPRSEAEAPSGPREQGSVKWFNVSKGFGFITKENGEEIFVHFRSIRGEGRRSLRDGQQVTFVEAQSDKGPQAEDVEPL